jgi:hypothetical protein
MNAVTNTELDEFSQRCALLVRGLQDLDILLPAYRAVADPLSYATAVCVIETLKLESSSLGYNELVNHTEYVGRLITALRQAIAEWLAERN